MTRITTPLDVFMRDLMDWLDGAWFLWAATAAAIVVLVVLVVVIKARARARARVPQYRRSGDGARVAVDALSRRSRGLG